MSYSTFAFERLWREFRSSGKVIALLPTSYREIARTVIVDNPAVANQETFDKIVSAIVSVPLDKISKVSLNMLVKEYGCPQVWVPAEKRK